MVLCKGSDYESCRPNHLFRKRAGPKNPAKSPTRIRRDFFPPVQRSSREQRRFESGRCTSTSQKEEDEQETRRAPQTQTKVKKRRSSKQDVRNGNHRLRVDIIYGELGTETACSTPWFRLGGTKSTLDAGNVVERHERSWVDPDCQNSGVSLGARCVRCIDWCWRLLDY